MTGGGWPWDLGSPHPALRSPWSHVVGPEVWVVLLDAVVQDRDHNALARQPLAPGLHDVQVRLHLVVLCKVGAGVSGALAPPGPTTQPGPLTMYHCLGNQGSVGTANERFTRRRSVCCSNHCTWRRMRTAGGGWTPTASPPSSQRSCPHSHGLERALPLPIFPTESHQKAPGCFHGRQASSPGPPRGGCVWGHSGGGMCLGSPLPVLGSSWCGIRPRTLCLLRLLFGVPTCLGLCHEGTRPSDHQSPGPTAMWPLLLKSNPAPSPVPVLDPSTQDLPISPL